MKIKFKPVWQFQSAEFEMDINLEEDIVKAFNIYQDILDRFMEIAPDQSKPFNPPTAKQKEIMDRFNIPYTNKTTYDQASKLIQESYNKR